ncbi:hypothetical protein ACWA2C_28305 [Priestia megaterium]
MKLIIFDGKDKVLSVYEGKDIQIYDDLINIDGNELAGISEQYIVVDDDSLDVKQGDKIDDVIKAKDKKDKVKKKKPGEEVQEDLEALKLESATQLNAIADIYELLLGGGEA